ncbi:hypothetical protein AB6A40_008238 [Gnathostoma spinigerum]|uniref:Uncharacterized protein n=1 Tax=Gnathostoma spinigerum TaxID=75299 RepID=A0ABD6EW96_9BILA
MAEWYGVTSEEITIAGSKPVGSPMTLGHSNENSSDEFWAFSRKFSGRLLDVLTKILPTNFGRSHEKISFENFLSVAASPRTTVTKVIHLCSEPRFEWFVEYFDG